MDPFLQPSWPYTRIYYSQHTKLWPIENNNYLQIINITFRIATDWIVGNKIQHYIWWNNNTNATHTLETSRLIQHPTRPPYSHSKQQQQQRHPDKINKLHSTTMITLHTLIQIKTLHLHISDKYRLQHTWADYNIPTTVTHTWATRSWSD